ncbi:MAG: S41 family peptidase [Candidatus Pacebacteria bacterium]|nr:S41 family peptidase [Bacteroidales bacterium]MDD3032787.1 S41 family peptidase [Candidatus Paceibacterota bacterium]MDD3918960.1 S41 family peptidase [Candidatus Paceibacterota bacterium]
MKISKEIIIVLSLCVGFSAGFFINQKLNEKLYTDLYTENTVNFSLLGEVWRNIDNNFVFENNINTEAMVYSAIKGFVSALEDPYTSFYDPEEAEVFQKDLEGTFDGIGIQIAKKDEKIKVIAPIKNTPAEKAGILAGDTIIKVNDENVSNIELNEIVSKIRGDNGTIVTLVIDRDGEEKTFNIERETIVVPSSELEFIDTNNGQIALLSLFQFSETTSRDVKIQINQILQKNNIKGIILDLRNNPGGLVSEAKNVASFFLEKDSKIVKECDKNDSCTWLLSDGPGKLSNYPIVILINQGTASAAEILTGALESNLESVTLVGDTSFGKGLVQRVMYLGDGSILKITTEEWYTPKDEQINEVGIEPDIKIEITKEDAELGQDPQLEKAKELINN